VLEDHSGLTLCPPADHSAKALLHGLPLKERDTQAPWDGHILEDALAVNARATISFPTAWQSPQCQLDQFVEFCPKSQLPLCSY
jgi:hypothetical protein